MFIPGDWLLHEASVYKYGSFMSNILNKKQIAIRNYVGFESNCSLVILSTAETLNLSRMETQET